MRPLKIAAVLILLIIIALAIAPLVEKPAATPEPMATPTPAAQASRPADAPMAAPSLPEAPAPASTLAATRALPVEADLAVAALLTTIRTAQTPDDKFIAMVELAESHPQDPLATQFFLESIHSSDGDTRLIAIECLRNMNNPAIIPQLQASLKGAPDAETREWITELVEYLQTTDSYAEATGDVPVRAPQRP